MNYGVFADFIKVLIYILFGVTVLLQVWTFITAKDIDKLIKTRSDISELEKKRNRLSRRYTIVLTLISIFPLLGMLGTVASLLNLDITEANAEMRNNFFSALDTTFAGLVSAIITKFTNSIFQAFIEQQEESANEHLEKRLS